YGQFSIGHRKVRAHRYSYELAAGPIPAGMQVDHRCRNRLCVRPSHLQIVTQSLNAQNLGQVRANNTSGFRGVWLDTRLGAWRAQANIDHRIFQLGPFDTKEEAAKAVSDFRREHMPNSLIDQ